MKYVCLIALALFLVSCSDGSLGDDSSDTGSSSVTLLETRTCERTGELMSGVNPGLIYTFRQTTKTYSDDTVVVTCYGSRGSNEFEQTTEGTVLVYPNCVLNWDEGGADNGGFFTFRETEIVLYTDLPSQGNGAEIDLSNDCTTN